MNVSARHSLNSLFAKFHGVPHQQLCRDFEMGPESTGTFCYHIRFYTGSRETSDILHSLLLCIGAATSQFTYIPVSRDSSDLQD
jgi:hypothetical protein